MTFLANSNAQQITPESSFGIEGLSSDSLGFEDAEVTSMLLQPDGKILSLDMLMTE